jgi:hypothetical protein
MFRSSIRLSAVFGGWLLAVVTHSAFAHKAPDPGPPDQKTPEMTRSTTDGIYTAEQATRGEKAYGMSCLGGCHNATAHKGGPFKETWNGQPLSELFAKIKDLMPDDNPGMLSPKEAADILAYILKLNGLPAGKEELSIDKAALAKIKIALPSPYAAPERR